MRSFGLPVLLALLPFAHGEPALTGPAAELFRQARSGKFFAIAEKLEPEILPTSDGRSFLTVWRATGKETPKHWMVSLPGREGFATDDLAIWSGHLRGRDMGLVSVQWWLGRREEGGDRGAYYTPPEVYREIDLALQKLGVAPGTVLFHGFSRGAANSYAIAALDAGRGRGYFALCVASSGGVALDYPPTRAITEGAFGGQPLRGTRWVTSAGGRDPEPERDGIPAMRRTAAWLEEQGATVVLRMEDADSGHGALVLNPANARRLLDLFLGGE